MNAIQSPLAFLARLLMAALFLPAGLSKVFGFAGTVGYISLVGLPMPEAAALLAILVELGAGLALLVGWQTRWAALVIMFIKNVAITGGLLALAAFGPGAWSLDAKRSAQ
jgi:putative oxidoreductase